MENNNKPELAKIFKEPIRCPWLTLLVDDPENALNKLLDGRSDLGSWMADDPITFLNHIIPFFIQEGYGEWFDTVLEKWLRGKPNINLQQQKELRWVLTNNNLPKSFILLMPDRFKPDMPLIINKYRILYGQNLKEDYAPDLKPSSLPTYETLLECLNVNMNIFDNAREKGIEFFIAKMSIANIKGMDPSVRLIGKEEILYEWDWKTGEWVMLEEEEPETLTKWQRIKNWFK